MSGQLPPLTALRAFEAAARHLSFARAADELNVTPAALSFQIKSLEEHLGTAAFLRKTRAVELTAAGRALEPGVRDGFANLRAAWQAAQNSVSSKTLTVTAGPAFTAKWLAPRLFAFAAAHPDIELRFSASLRLMDFERDAIDVAIRFGYARDEDMYSEPVMREWVTPMASPEVARRSGPPEDLLRQTLLHQDDTAFLKPSIEWPAWFRAAGVAPGPLTGPRFSQADHAIDAALSGGGVVLGRASLAAQHLRDGTLEAPFDLCLSTEAHYRFVCPEGAETRPQIASFLAWIRNEAADHGALAEGRRLVPAADVPE